MQNAVVNKKDNSFKVRQQIRQLASRDYRQWMYVVLISAKWMPMLWGQCKFSIFIKLKGKLRFNKISIQLQWNKIFWDSNHPSIISYNSWIKITFFLFSSFYRLLSLIITFPVYPPLIFKEILRSWRLEWWKIYTA